MAAFFCGIFLDKYIFIRIRVKVSKVVMDKGSQNDTLIILK